MCMYKSFINLYLGFCSACSGLLMCFYLFECSYECKLCLTLHNNEGNYLAHTQGKRHQTNLAKRAAREAKEAPAQPQPHKRKVAVKRSGKSGFPFLFTYLCFSGFFYALFCLC